MTQKKAIYALGNAPEWLSVVGNFQRELGWQPFYWITVARNHDAVGEQFPSVHRHDFADLNRCLPAPGYSDRQWRGLDAETLKEFSECEQITIEMMDRMDLGGTFAFDERQRTYLWHLSYWLTIVAEERPHVVVFNAPPHSPGEFVLHEVCRRRDVGVRVYLPTQLGALHLVGSSYDAVPDHLIEAYERRLADGNQSLSQDILQALDEVRSPSGVSPWYVNEAKEREARRSRQKTKIEKALANGETGNVPLSLDPEKRTGFFRRKRKPEDSQVSSTKIRRVYKRPDQPLSAPLLSKDEYRTYLRWAYVQKVKLEQAYRRVAQKPDLTKPYVFLALHYQPERTTCPDGGRFNNQFLAATMLAQGLPEGWQLYIKEHPNQYAYHNNGEQTRRPEFYDDLLSLPNTCLVQMDTPSHDLKMNARAVATITGYIGWEALLNEIPVIVFGAAWYRSCRGVSIVRTQSDVNSALAQIAGGAKPKLDEVIAFAGALQDAGTVCYSNTSMAPAVKIDSADLVTALTSTLLRFEKHVTPARTQVRAEEVSVVCGDSTRSAKEGQLDERP